MRETFLFPSSLLFLASSPLVEIHQPISSPISTPLVGKHQPIVLPSSTPSVGKHQGSILVYLNIQKSHLLYNYSMIENDFCQYILCLYGKPIFYCSFRIRILASYGANIEESSFSPVDTNTGEKPSVFVYAFCCPLPKLQSTI